MKVDRENPIACPSEHERLTSRRRTVNKLRSSKVIAKRQSGLDTEKYNENNQAGLKTVYTFNIRSSQALPTLTRRLLEWKKQLKTTRKIKKICISLGRV